MPGHLCPSRRGDLLGVPPGCASDSKQVWLMDHGPAIQGSVKRDAPPGVAPGEARTGSHRSTAASGRSILAGWPLLVVLATQSILTLRLVRSDTAFQDEALYLWAGHLEWANVLHGTPLPQFPAFFSGAPVIYPPLGALADSIGGLTGARILSLVFMLGATVALWATASRLFGRRAAFFAAALFAVLGPDAAPWLVRHLRRHVFVPGGSGGLARRPGRRSAVTRPAGWWRPERVLALANATSYSSALFDPTRDPARLAHGLPEAWRQARRRHAP